MKRNSIFKLFFLGLAIGIMSCSSSDDSGSGSGDGSGSGSGNGNGSGSGNGNGGETTSINVSTERTNLFVNTNMAIVVKDNNGTDVTSSSEIKVNGTVISSNPHNFSTEGDNVITATYNSVSDDTGVTVKAVTPTHTQKVLVEDYTGTWCGYCPRLAYKLDNLAANNSKVIPVGVHNDNDMGFSQVSTLENSFSVSGYPTGKINRIITWNETDTQVLNQTNTQRECGLAINSSISGSTLSVTAKVHYDIDSYKDQKLVVYVLENGIIAAQANYMNNDSSSPWYQAGDPISNFEHNHVLRSSLTNVLGDDIPNDQEVMGTTYSKDFTFTIPGNYNTSKLEVVAFVVDSDKRVMNAQKVAAGSNKDFD